MSQPKIVVVEDEGIVAKNIKHMLKGLGYEVPAIVSSGKDAIQKAAETKPDLMLMDIVLEGDMDGIEAAKQIQTRFDIPVVYLTAHADDTTVLRAKMTAPYGYLLKPFDERELHAAIELALYKHKMEREVTPSTENTELERVLKELVKIRGVNAAAVISKDGLLVKFVGPFTREDMLSLSSVIAFMTKAAEKCTRMLKGEIEEIIAKGHNVMIVTEKCAEFIFFVAVDKDIDIDAIKPQREKVRDIIYEGRV
jgi:CheY-like chemotaxis protein